MLPRCPSPAWLSECVTLPLDAKTRLLDCQPKSASASSTCQTNLRSTTIDRSCHVMFATLPCVRHKQKLPQSEFEIFVRSSCVNRLHNVCMWVCNAYVMISVFAYVQTCCLPVGPAHPTSSTRVVFFWPVRVKATHECAKDCSIMRRTCTQCTCVCNASVVASQGRLRTKKVLYRA